MFCFIHSIAYGMPQPNHRPCVVQFFLLQYFVRSFHAQSMAHTHRTQSKHRNTHIALEGLCKKSKSVNRWNRSTDKRHAFMHILNWACACAHAFETRQTISIKPTRKMHAHGQRERERAAAANKSNTLTNRTIDAERLVRFYIFFSFVAQTNMIAVRIAKRAREL